ncbi:MAG: sulfatase-like hydrolase/transferase [Candidatus Latescibacteria bacterium]|nr:sulfatase-like hydrolase/transferase [Candidatus Latescibacterota bacterium]
MISPDCYLPSRQISQHVNLRNIRSIGDQGTFFTNAMCTSPLCGPSRASIFTGKYPPYLTNGERAPLGMKTDLYEEDTIFQEYLRKAGYITKHTGKCHVGTLKFMDAFGENDAAWDRWAPPLLDDDDYVAFLSAKGVQPPVYKKELRGKQYDRTTPGNSLGGWIVQANGKDFPPDAHYSVYLAEKAATKLDAALKQSPDVPVYLQLDFFDPHQPFSIPSGFEQRALELKRHITLPDSYLRIRDNDFRPMKDEPAIYNVYRRYWGAYDPQLVSDYILGHFLQMEVVDYALGKLFDEIRRRGIWDDSLIIFSGDHGEINGRRGLFDKGVYFQPDIFRVPLYMKLPKDENSKTGKYDKPVSTLDICATILGNAGIRNFESLDGEDLTPVMHGDRERSTLEQIFQTGWHVGVNYGAGFQIYENSEHHWFYGYNITGGEEELYNMAEPDPVNLIDNVRYQDVRKKIVRKVGEVLSKDPRWLGYWSTFRLHNAEMLPKSGEDMQMFVPKKE